LLPVFFYSRKYLCLFLPLKSPFRMRFPLLNTKNAFVLLLGAFSCASDQTPRPQTPSAQPIPVTAPIVEAPAPDASFAALMLAEVNALRAVGCRCPGGKRYPAAKALKWDDQLAQAAQKHAADMEKNSFFDHTGSDGSDFSERIEKAGYRWRAVAENLAQGHPNVADVVKGWRNSKGHCKNLMDGNLRDMGAARVGAYWVQTLGTRM
jgi:uncharacterized protein YkwD